MAVRFYHEFTDRANYLNKIEISADSWGGGPSLITHSSGDPIITRHAGERAGRNIIQGREVQFEFFVFPEDMDRYDDIFISDYGDYKITHRVAGELIFEGWLLPDNLSRDFFKDKYIISLSATDGLAKLQNTTFLTTNDEIIEGVIYQLEAIKYAIAKIGLELDFRVQLGTYESALMGAGDCALAVIGCDTRRFYPGGKPMTCGQVIEAILKPYSCTLKQQDGFWQITNKQEGDSMQFVFAYASLAQTGRTATAKIVDLTGYKYGKAYMSKIGPLRDFGISFHNRDLGEDITGVDLTDWEGAWTHTFDYHSVDAGTIQLYSGAGYPGDYIEPLTDWNVPYVFPFNSTTYFVVTFNYYIETITPTRPNPILLISVKRPDGTYSDPLFYYPTLDNWTPFDSKFHPRLRLLSAGDHNLRFTFEHDADTDPGNYNFFLRNVNISIVDSPGEGNTNIDDPASQDEYYMQTTGRNLEIVEDITLFADGTKVTETGALLHNLTTLTTVWNTYGGGEGIPLLDIWARNELNNRYGFKDFLKVTVHDLDNSIDIDSILSIKGKYYNVVSYYKNHKKCIVEAAVEELLLTKNSYSAISSFTLTSVEGENVSASTYSNEIGVHNYLIGIQGGTDNEYFHLEEGQHTELTAWLDNVILSDAGGIDMDGTLEVDQLLEHTPDAGIMVEMVNISTAAITTAEANMTFQDDTGGPYTLAQLYAGGAPAAHATSHEVDGGDLVDHNNLTNYVANRHINHISVTLVAGTGLSGGGTIDATRTFNLDLSDLTGITSLASADEFGVYDSGIGTRNITYANLITNLNSDLNFSPLSHTHGNITNAGAIGAAATLPIITTTDGVLTVGSFGTGAGTFCQGNDARLSDSRTPTAHAASHHTGGSDLVNHDSLTGFVAAEHYSHTTISMGTAASSGLSGGGTIAATRALVLAVNRLTEVTTLQTSDHFPFYDDSGSGTRRISYANMLTQLNFALTIPPGFTWINAGTDRIGTYASATTINGEANLTFDGTLLTIATGGITTHGAYSQYNTADTDERLTMVASVNDYVSIYNWDEGSSTYKYLRLGSNVANQGITIDGATGNVGLCTAPSAGTYYRVNIGGTTTIVASEAGSLDLEVNNTHSTGSTRFVLGVNDKNKFTVLQLNYAGDGIFKLGLGDIIWGWDSSANMSIGTTVTESTTRLYCAANKVSGYAAHFFNDGNGTNRFGIKISCGTDDQSGTVNYFLKGFAGNKTTEEGGLRNASGTFAVYQGSDRRRKTNIVDTEIDTAGILSSLKVRDYNRIGSKGKLSNKQTGWIAQEVAEIFPTMHGYSKDTDLHSVTPTELIPVLHKGWQLHEEKLTEHQKKINRLERHILTLETKIKNNESEIKRLG